MLLSIIIVNYKTSKLVADCLHSIAANDSPLSSFEIFVVDNNSNDGIEAMLATGFPTVQFLQMGYNAGFARANNAAIKIAKGDAVLLLNSDTLVLQNAISNSFRKLMESNYIAAGVQLLNEDGSLQFSGSKAMMGGLNYLLPLPYIGRVLRRVALSIGAQKPGVEKAASAQEVDWINGAYLMVKKSAIDKAGLMDEDFFLYAEEAEWCGRLKKVGPLCIFGNDKVVHLQGESAGVAFDSKAKGYQNIFDKKGKQIILSNLLRIRKQFGLLWFFVILAAYCVAVPVFFMGLVVEKIIFGNSLYSYKDFTGFADNLVELIPFLPSIIFNKRRFYKVL